jgi:hypothetical protein
MERIPSLSQDYIPYTDLLLLQIPKETKIIFSSKKPRNQ